MPNTVVVVGAGVTGLVAARQLAMDESLEVIVLEASDRVGGQIRTERIDGALVDVGAEAIHLGAPQVAGLVRELGLDDTVIGAAPGASVLATRKGLRPLPAGVGPTGPTKILPVLKSGILTPAGLLRAGLEPLMARHRVEGDEGVGVFTRRRFGREVTDTFVDPLLGNLHGGDVRLLSLQSTAPQLVGDAASGTSMLLKSLRRTKSAAPAPASALPMFASWPEGLETFTRALADQSGAAILTNSAVTGLTRDSGRWTVEVGDQTISADQVLFTTPADVTAGLLETVCPEVTRALAWVPQVSVATVVLGWPREQARRSQMLRDSNGVLLPGKAVRTFKAATNLSRKWPSLGSAHHLLRASVGRFGSTAAEDLDDDAMTAAVAAELAELAGTPWQPEVREVFRWPRSMPQLQPGHADRISAARDALHEVGGLWIAGCGVDGLGIGSTVKSANRAATEIVFHVHRDNPEELPAWAQTNHHSRGVK